MVYLQISLDVADADRGTAAGIYEQYKAPFLKTVPGAKSKALLIRAEDVQVLHGFETPAHAEAYLKSALFNDDVVTGLKPLLRATPDVRIYSVA